MHTVFPSARAQATSVITIAPQTPHRTRSLSRSSLGIYVAMRRLRRPHPFAIMQRTRLFATQQKDALHQSQDPLIREFRKRSPQNNQKIKQPRPACGLAPNLLMGFLNSNQPSWLAEMFRRTEWA